MTKEHDRWYARAQRGGSQPALLRPALWALAGAAVFIYVAQAQAPEDVGRVPSLPATAGERPGTLEGVITLGGSGLPQPTRTLNSTDPEVCGREHSLQDLVVSAENHGIQYVIVALDEGPPGRLPAGAPKRVVIDNRDCRFAPHAAVAMAGDTIVAKNSDPTLHNTHYYGPLSANIALPVKGMSVSRVARRPGLVTVLCDVHGWMKAYVRVDPHPFHAVSDERGFFRIPDVPPGPHTVELWHEKLGTRQVQVRIEAGRVTRIDAEYPPPER